MKHDINVVFDLDGTLIDSAPTAENILNEMRADFGLGPILRETLQPLLSIGGITMVQKALETDLSNATTALERFRAEYHRRPTPPMSVYPGVSEALTKLSDAKIALSVCTNKPRALAIKAMREVDILRYFVKICAGDDLPTKKPNPANIKASIVAQDPLKSKVFLVGDSTVDQLLAKNSSVPFVFFSGGYDDGVDLGSALKNFRSYEDFPFELFF